MPIHYRPTVRPYAIVDENRQPLLTFIADAYKPAFDEERLNSAKDQNGMGKHHIHPANYGPKSEHELMIKVYKAWRKYEQGGTLCPMTIRGLGHRR